MAAGCGHRPRVVFGLWGLSLGLLVAGAGGLACLLPVRGAAVRILPVDELRSDGDAAARLYAPWETGENQAELGAILRRQGITPEDGKSLEQVAAVSAFLGETVRRVESGADGTPLELLRHAQKGGGLLCSGMAEALRELLAVLGYRARVVCLYAGSFRPWDTHVLVEADLDGWVAFDPTFHVTYRDGNRPLGVAEIQARLRQMGPASVTPVSHGERPYPARLDTYHMGWRPLFNNAFIRASRPGVGAAGRLPPFRWWYGPRWYVFGDCPNEIIAAQQRLYFLVCVALPVAGMLAAAGALGCTLLWRPRPARAGPP